jgi:PiT family inorganic phosphate transporter
VAHFIGPFLFEVSVATSISHEAVDSAAISSTIIIAALSGAIVWHLITWYFGWPSSTCRALIGGLIGAVAVAEGFGTIHLVGLQKVLIALLLAPILGLALG